MNKSQKTIVTLEIIILIVGFALLGILSANSDGGKRKEIAGKLTAMRDKLTSSKEQYSSNPAIVEIIEGKEKQITDMIAGYQDKENKYDFAMETRKLTMLETEISCFVDDCVKINDEIKDINAFIQKAETYLKEKDGDISKTTTHKKVPRATKNEIRTAEKRLEDGLDKLKRGLGSSATPEDFTQLSLDTLDLGQPFVELQNKVEHALKLIQEKKINTETKIDIPIVIIPPKETRIKVKKSDPVLQEKVIPDYPEKFQGNGYFAIIGVQIGTDGSPKSTSVVRSSGNTEFDKFCQEQALGLRFSPAKAYYKDTPGELFPIEAASQYPFKCN